MTALIDTGFLFAVLDADDDRHEECVLALQEEREPVLPNVVLPELAYLVLRELGYPVLIKFLHALAKGELKVENVIVSDLGRSAELLEKYADSQIDFVDCAITAMAERFNIERILTVDQRHFRLLRPKHCTVFVIAPS